MSSDTMIGLKMTWIKKLWQTSIFFPLTLERSYVNETIALLFHRSAALLYFLYAIWGVSTTFGGIPTLIRINGDTWQVFFSLLIALTSLPAFVGACYFPRLSRLELFAISSFSSLIFIYIGVLIVLAFHGDTARFAAIPLITSLAIIPLSRIFFIYTKLIKQAKDKVDE